MPIELSQGFRFGAFTAEPLKGSVAGDDGQSRHLAPKAMDLLVRLAEAAPNPVTRDDLITAVWGERYVSDEVLTHAIWDLRRAFGDNASDPEFIQTIPKKGYRLIAPVKPAGRPRRREAPVRRLIGDAPRGDTSMRYSISLVRIARLAGRRKAPGKHPGPLISPA